MLLFNAARLESTLSSEDRIYTFNLFSTPGGKWAIDMSRIKTWT